MIKKRPLLTITFMTVVILIGSIYVFMPRISCTPDSNIYAAKAQLQNYVVSLKQYKADYGHYPVFINDDGIIDLSRSKTLIDFFEAMTGKDYETQETLPSSRGKKSQQYYEFKDDELIVDSGGVPILLDIYGNSNIVIIVDKNEDTFITLPFKHEPQRIRGSVIAYSKETNNTPIIKTWE